MIGHQHFRWVHIALAAVLGVASSAGIALAGDGAPAAAPIELRMATLAPSGSRWEKTLTDSTVKVDKATPFPAAEMDAALAATGAA